MADHHASDRRPVAATDLAQRARCEQQALFDARYGSQRSAARDKAAQAGDAEHARHDQLVRRYQAPSDDRRCFVASAVYGETAWQTAALRAWRDRAWRPLILGRLAIRLYYALSPPLARWLHRHPSARHGGRWLLDRVVARIVQAGSGQ